MRVRSVRVRSPQASRPLSLAAAVAVIPAALAVSAAGLLPTAARAQTQVWSTTTIHGTSGVVGRRDSTTTAQVWSTTPGTTIQSGTVYYGPDGQVIGVGPGMTSGPVYVPVPVPVMPYPPTRPMPPGPPNGWAPPHRSDGYPYGPNVVPGWGGQPAPDYRNSPQALPPRNPPGYYLPR
ncbi:MAG: hypothetical protein QM766_08425 [Burkholderiaceae bacterium]